MRDDGKRDSPSPNQAHDQRGPVSMTSHESNKNDNIPSKLETAGMASSEASAISRTDLNSERTKEDAKRMSNSASPTTSPARRADTKLSEKSFKHTLSYVEEDFRRMLSILPIPLHQIVPKFVVKFAARMLFRARLLATDSLFDFTIVFLRLIVVIFFREIQPRSSWRIPREGPIIFVVAPHHNQFLDPLILASEVRNAGRRVSFLIAHKSTKRPLIGRFSRMLRSIPVRRAADDAKVGSGTVTAHPSGDETLLLGINSEFTKQAQVRGHVVLPKSTDYAMAEVAEILSDTELRLKKPFPSDAASEALRTQDNEDPSKVIGTSYKLQPYVNQAEMYASVYRQLSDGGCLCIFPEGGSHDRTDLLPLKAGVVIMALGAMANDPNLNVSIVPVGLSYFHPHRFRSRAVIEFGMPINVPKDLVELFEHGGTSKRQAIASMLDIVFDGLKSVTVRAPDYETLMVIQASRRLMSLPGQQLSLSDKVEQNRKLIMGYMQFKDHPKVVALRESVLTYNKHLKQVGIRDHQVERANRSVLRSLALLMYRLGLLVVWSGCALPGTILNLPIIVFAKVVSKKKAKEALAASQVKLFGRDVLATWKVIVTLVVAPILYASYAVVATTLAYRSNSLRLIHKRLMPLYVMLGMPAISVGVIKMNEVGIDVYKSLPPLIASLLPGRRRVIDQIQQERINLTAQLHSTIAELRPEGWNYTDIARGSYTAKAPPIREELEQMMYDGRPLDSTGGHSLSHPMNVMDEWLFGWSSSRRKGDWGGHRAEVVENDLGANYEDALQVYEHETDEAHRLTRDNRGKEKRRTRSQDYRERRQAAQPSPSSRKDSS